MVQIRKATLDDAEPLAPIAAQAFRDGWQEVIGERIAETYIAGNLTVQNLRDDIAAPESIFLVATAADDLPVGYGRLHLSRPAPDAVVRQWKQAVLLQRLYISGTHRGAGVADVLLAALTDEAQKRGFQALWLECDPRNPRAWRYYEKRGFVDVGGTIYYYTKPDGTTAVANDQVRVMVKEITS